MAAFCNSLRALNGIERPGGQAVGMAKVLSTGAMAGSALLYPVVEQDNHQFCALILSIYIVSAVVFHLLNIEAFIRHGPMTVSVGFVLYLLAVMLSGPSRSGLIPYLPLLMTTTSLATIALSAMGVRRPARGGEAQEPDSVSMAQGSRWCPYLAHMTGPSSRYSPQQNQFSSDLGLSSITPRVRPHWDPETRTFFAGDGARTPDIESQRGAVARLGTDGAAYNFPPRSEAETDLPDTEAGSMAPLLPEGQD